MSAEKRKKQDVMKKNIEDGCEKKKVRCKTLVLQVHGAKYKTTFNKKFDQRKNWVKHNPKDVISYIPGTVKDIFLKEGDQVKKGDKLLILEAMKMLNTIEIPMDGKIRKLHVKGEDRIPKGFLMLEIE